MKKRRLASGRHLLQGVTPYPWRRDSNGDLCGADGQPIYFSGADAVIVEYSPEMAEALDAVRKIATAHDPSSTAVLKQIFHLADELISRIEAAKSERKWCTGIVRS